MQASSSYHTSVPTIVYLSLHLTFVVEVDTIPSQLEQVVDDGAVSLSQGSLLGRGTRPGRRQASEA